mmetsp:Transcript_100182/g.323153  ORF Transcript_100182/g.323153 Transcript_100182/m.323153 type:complete len:293 (-) Transcript_100182:1536-2414(-)
MDRRVAASIGGPRPQHAADGRGLTAHPPVLVDGKHVEGFAVLVRSGRTKLAERLGNRQPHAPMWVDAERDDCRDTLCPQLLGTAQVQKGLHRTAAHSRRLIGEQRRVPCNAVWPCRRPEVPQHCRSRSAHRLQGVLQQISDMRYCISRVYLTELCKGLHSRTAHRRRAVGQTVGKRRGVRCCPGPERGQLAHGSQADLLVLVLQAGCTALSHQAACARLATVQLLEDLGGCPADGRVAVTKCSLNVRTQLLSCCQASRIETIPHLPNGHHSQQRSLCTCPHLVVSVTELACR